MLELQIKQHPFLTSLDFDWDIERRETFTSEADEYDVQAAKYLLSSLPHPLMWLGFEEGGLKDHLERVGLDKGRVSFVDPNFPVIFRTGDDGAIYPIDGNHRLAQIDQIGQNWMRAFILTAMESRIICSLGGAIYTVRDIANMDWWRCEFQIELITNAGENKEMRFDDVKCDHCNFYLVGTAGISVAVQPNTPVRFVTRRVRPV